MSSRLRTRLRAGTGLSTPSLNLEFQTATGALDPRITFSRTSQATLVDSTGKLTYAPNNLLTNSETFEASGWTKYAANISSNLTAAPDGTTTADKAIATAVAAYHGVALSISLNPTPYIFSIYVKASEYSRFRISDGASARFAASFTLTGNGVVSDTTGANFVSAAITPVGNGWYRCSVQVNNISGSAAFQFMGYPAGATLDGYGVQYTGDGTSGIFIWGAQLEQVTYQTTPGTYNSTSPKNLLGYTQEFDNAAWTKSNAFVQTNLLTYSEAFDNAAWPKTNATVTANSTTSPTGSVTADTLVEDTANAQHTVAQTATLAASTTYTITVYAKRAVGTRDVFIQVNTSGGTTGAGFASFNLSNGTASAITTLSGTFVGVSATATSVGGDWYRCALTFTTNAGNTGATIYVSLFNAARVYTGDGTSGVYLWGAQLVQGSTAGDYQRTDAAAAAVQYVAPDGSRTADKLVANTTAAVHCVQQNATTAAPVAVSFYAKAAEYASAAIGSNANNYVYFDLTNGVVSSTLGTGWSSATITAVGNGWYRCAAFTSVSNTRYDIFAVNAVGTNGNTAPSYTGDGTSGIYIWGAQLSNSASLDPYVYNPVAAPTSAAYYGPRFDYEPVTLANKGLLIEEQRTNLLTYSQQFDDAAWSKSNVSVTANAVTSPDGTVGADAVIPNTTSSTHLIRPASSVSVSGNTGAHSFYVKAAGYSRIGIRETHVTGNWATFNLSSGTIIASSGMTNVGIAAVGNGWYRIVATDVAATQRVAVYVMNNSYTSGDPDLYAYSGDGTSGIYLFGAQLEAGSFATSYIPTVASQVTRTADVASMQGANFSNWYNPNGGTIVVSASQPTIFASSRSTTSISLPSANVPRITTYRQSASGVNFYAVNSAVVGNAINSGVTATAGVIHKTAASYNATSQQTLSVNGSAVAVMNVDMASDLGRLNSLSIGSDFIGSTNSIWCGHIQGIAYYPTVLANAQLQSLTAQSTIPSLSLDFTTQVFNVG